jgi:hypothetical protein
VVLAHEPRTGSEARRRIRSRARRPADADFRVLAGVPDEEVLEREARLLIETGVVAVVPVKRCHHPPPVAGRHQLWRKGDVTGGALGLKGGRRVGRQAQLVRMRRERDRQQQCGRQEQGFHLSGPPSGMR